MLSLDDCPLWVSSGRSELFYPNGGFRAVSGRSSLDECQLPPKPGVQLVEIWLQRTAANGHKRPLYLSLSPCIYFDYSFSRRVQPLRIRLILFGEVDGVKFVRLRAFLCRPPSLCGC